MSSSRLSYRSEIDGLRAIAVVSVILYHAQIALFGRDWFEGGYIGVDIFFVISGYLITRIILSELHAKGSFSFLDFYERRARRILPMLFVVIFISIPFAWQKLLPLNFVEYAKSILASLFFSSNFFFYFSTTQYGADSALLKPFLNTWSLGVEEQFYLVFPILAILSYKYYSKHFFTILVALSLLSLQFAELMEIRNSDLNFYLPFSRFWELAIGSMLAYRELNYRPLGDGIAKRAFPMLGLYLIIYSILFFDSKTPHPGFHTLIPIVGVALIIAFASKDELVGKLLGSKLFVWIGLISYSAYLWHYPIFAFSRMGVNNHSNYDKFGWILITLALSISSYVLIEKPFRRSINKKCFVVLLASSSILLITFSYYVVNSDGVPTVSRLGFNGKLIETVRRPTESFENGVDSCNDGSVLINGVSWCELGQKSASNYNVVVLGDSHSMSSTVTLNKVLSENGVKGLYFGTSGCPPLINLYAVRGYPHPNLQSTLCQNHVRAALDLAKNKRIKSVILIARWDYYVDGSDSGSWQSITDQSFQNLDKQQARNEYEKAVKNTYYAFARENVKVYVLLQIPHQKVNPKRIFEALMTKNNPKESISYLSDMADTFLKVEEHKQRQTIASKAWKKLAEDEDSGEKLTLLDPSKVFCNSNDCPIYDNKTSFYFDTDHASTDGFARLEAMFRRELFQ
jgi:peptidoglycan/LPS O-acetylase OafA/YrhL